MVRQVASIEPQALQDKLKALGIPIVSNARLHMLAWNNLFKGKDATPLPEPLAIATPQNEEQVSAAVQLAISLGLPVGVRSGGHHYGCCWSTAGALLLDMGALAHCEIDGATARIGPGVTGATLYDALDGTGRHFPGPHLSSVACGGFIAGGGNGFGTPLFGAACDCLVSVRMVDGRTGKVHTVDADSDSDLWFAIRGAGGFYGVITEYTVQLFSIPALLPSSLAVFALSNSNQPPGAATPAAVVAGLEAWARSMPTMPPAVECNAVLCGGGPAMDPCLVVASNAFAEATPAVDAALDQCKLLVPNHMPMVWQRDPVPYREAMRAIDPTYEFPGVCCYGGVLCFQPETLGQELLHNVVDAYMRRTSPRSVVLFAPGFPSTDAPCAAGYRRGCVIIGTYALWARTEGGALVDRDEEHIAWADELMRKLKPLAVNQYVNETMFLDTKDTSGCYEPADYARLVQLKAKYDPQNTFRSL